MVPSPLNLRTTKSLPTLYMHTNTDHRKFSWIWALNKIKFFIWLCYHNRLPTSIYLKNIGLDVDPFCKTRNQPEIIEHIFLQCVHVHVQKLWDNLNINRTIKSLASQQNGNWLTLLKNLKVKLKNEHLNWKQAFPFNLWHIWLNRNHNLFKGTTTDSFASIPYGWAVEFFI